MQPHAMLWRPLADRCARLAARSLFRRTIRARNERAVISFTFDDIDATAATAGAAILEKYGIRGTFYVAGRFLELSGRKGPFASREDCRRLAERGHEIACHTYSHVPVRRLSGQQLRADVARNSACVLGSDSVATLESFAFPYNAPTLTAKRILSQTFTSCRGGVPGINSGEIDRAFLKAVVLDDKDLAQKWIDAAVAVNGWLIFFTHDVKPCPSPHGCTPDLLEAAVALAVRSGAEVLAVREAVARVRGLPEPQPASAVAPADARCTGGAAR